MFPRSAEDKEKIKELAAPIAVEFAPEQFRHFDELVEDYFDDPNPPQPSEEAHYGLPFGLDPSTLQAIVDALIMTMPIIEGFLSRLPEFAAGISIVNVVHNWFTYKKKHEIPPELVDEIKETINNTLVQKWNVPQEKADEITKRASDQLLEDNENEAN